MKFLVGNPVFDLITEVNLLYEKQDNGFVDFSIKTRTREYALNVKTVVLQIVFMLFFLLNMYLFLSQEHSTYQRFKKWH